MPASLMTPEIRVADPDEGGAVLVGYASVFYDGSDGTEFQLWSDAVERIMPNAFDDALSRPDDVRALFNHDPSNLLGRTGAGTLRLAADDVGLRYEIDLPNTPRADEVRTLVERGDLTGSSFAFLVTDQEWRTEDSVDIREISGVELFDVGPVTYPAYESTTVGTRGLSLVCDDARETHRKYLRAKQKQQAAAMRKRAAAVAVASRRA